jgi:hypothetical protein
MHQQVQPSLHFHRDFFRQHWHYRQQTLPPHQSPPGHSLLLIPFQRFVHGVLVRRVGNR